MKGRSAKEHASKEQELRWQGIFGMRVSKGGYIYWQ